MKYIELITDAYRLRNVIDEYETPSPEQGLFALRKLNQMCAVWKATGVDVQYFPTDNVQDTLTIPDWAEMGVTASLAIAIAAGAAITPELEKMHEDGMRAINNKTIGAELGEEVSTALPCAEGQRPKGDFRYG